MSSGSPNVYLSQADARWNPRTEDELRRAADNGLLAETHYLDLKRELTASKNANKEHAKNMASLAIDGGALLIGLDEDKQARTVSLTPQPLQGLRERIEQIALTNIDPPLAVATREIASSQPGEGYVVVHIPASGAAPHMVDGRYWGRTDSTKYSLSDPEVLRLHSQRRSSARNVLDLLHVYQDRDPLPAHEQAHLYLVAEPDSPRPDMLRDYLRMEGNNLIALVKRGAYGGGAAHAFAGAENFSPTISHATMGSARAHGTALTTGNLTSGRALVAGYNTDDVVELELSDDGGIRVLMTRLSDNINGGQEVLTVAAPLYTRGVLGIITELAECTGYLGSWSIAVGARGLQGLPAYTPGGMAGLLNSVFEEDTYEKTAHCSHLELLRMPGTITSTLISGFLRNLGAERNPDAIRAFDNPQPS